MTAYDFAILNVQRAIHSEDNRSAANPITLFDAIPIIAIAFCKTQNDVTNDLLFRNFED